MSNEKVENVDQGGGTSQKPTNNETNSKQDAEPDTCKASAGFHPERLVPQLHGVTEGDLKVAIKVLEAVASLHPSNSRRGNKRKQGNGDNGNNNNETLATAENGLELYRQPNLRPFRKALSGCLELHKKLMYQGKSEEEHYELVKQERSLKRQKMAERQHQKKYIAETSLRKGRVERLQKLKQEAKEEEEERLMAMMVPDGHVETSGKTATKRLENGPVVETVQEEEDEDTSTAKQQDDETNNIRLPKLRSCYVCKVRFRELHRFYDQLCPTCAPLNWDKRHQTADCSGMVAVVTGSRVKIGYQTCLKLLRAGATVVATTRFPNSAAATYRAEPDFTQWKDRLHVFGLDLRDVTGLEAFTRFLKLRFYPQGIDILINNACQTVRRPRGYYVPMIEKEQSLWNGSDDTHKSLLGQCAEFEQVRRKLLLDHKQQHSTSQLDGDKKNAPLLQMAMDNSVNDEATVASTVKTGVVSQEMVATAASATEGTISMNHATEAAPFETTGLSHSAAMSQMIILPEDVGVADSVLPPGVSDVNGQQLDLRHTNSWLLKMEEVSTPEIMECMFINAIAPFVLNSRLKPLMTTPNNDTRPDRYVINVSAMEGKFYRYKMPNHPHTNMAKAALNMMTRTSAEDLAKKHRIYMNSVDTGWINDENPLERASKTAKTNLFQTPIDEIDAAARILDPVFSGINGGKDMEKDFGKFLKDYKETEW